ncbi:MAG: hypothetical protein UW46_C0004G0076 [Candidatus Yanofskybacteria bacterium GW2011_GWF1_44_227]|uniref:Uncharacterized protein n=1 Tax=Candidatus Yanofskybacteria bacterium GW2011_GWE2_40_11 TaxID=1619033 RepID=A0A0G0QTE4_9BACT|nr:MAG: hypothetical protein UT69_C0009G0008 [Candidatus Yanofskybacteria bacterium GW2011_GWE1_40_10]KKR40601.1 MAG: hypothetical protein UT75_C0007G0049 [Candidatus Yanofskybacteria bacterium GW2011_GWE2_40_11]KKT15601.1 MAG: hypothetical protein UV97_C0004G0017 [Candidatus Yanofskybacteria bacterium GW2011_GWF2_43_596]KKT53349.1 MAG: hypothetical protein UW46_C0004G0076 [Candidatus Yanofskybacteria bacterium GW2011_GWF1_44_227]
MSKCRDTIANTITSARRHIIKENIDFYSIVGHFYDLDCLAFIALSD